MLAAVPSGRPRAFGIRVSLAALRRPCTFKSEGKRKTPPERLSSGGVQSLGPDSLPSEGSSVSDARADAWRGDAKVECAQSIFRSSVHASLCFSLAQSCLYAQGTRLLRLSILQVKRGSEDFSSVRRDVQARWLSVRFVPNVTAYSSSSTSCREGGRRKTLASRRRPSVRRRWPKRADLRSRAPPTREAR